MLCCPITSRAKGYPFAVELPAGTVLQGVVLADQVESLDWRARAAEVAGRIPADVTCEVIDNLGSLLALSGAGEARSQRVLITMSLPSRATCSVPGQPSIS